MSYDADLRSDILVYVKWLNPYTNKEEEDGIFLPDEIIDKVIPNWLKDLGIQANSSQFKKLFDELDLEYKVLEQSSDFVDRCIKEYYDSEYYEEDKAMFLDDYEVLNNLGQYEEEDEYVG